MNEEFAMLLFLFGISLTANVAFWIGARRHHRRIRELEGRDHAPANFDDTTERLERSVEALALQVDQLASGQEFLNRLVTERLVRSGHPLPAPERPITPH